MYREVCTGFGICNFVIQHTAYIEGGEGGRENGDKVRVVWCIISSAPDFQCARTLFVCFCV